MINLYDSYPDFVIETFDDMHCIFKYAQSFIEMEYYSLFFSSTKRNIKDSNFITNNDLILKNQKEVKKYEIENSLFEYCMRNSMPLIWNCKDLDKKPYLFHDIKKYGLNHGISFPIHGINHEIGILTISFYSDACNYVNQINKNLVNLMVLRDVLLNHLIILGDKKNKIKLSKKEKEICSWYLNGKTTWEISKIINCSESNVNFHFKNIREKFNVTSRSAAIIKAIEIGQIKL